METYNQFESPGNSVSMMGLISKTLLGIIIVFFVAIPRLFNGELFLEFLYTTNNFFSYLILTLVVIIVLGIVWAILYKSLKTNKGFILNLFVYVITCIFIGLFTSNSLIFAVYFISYYANGAVDATMVMDALQIASMATFIAILGGTLALPKLKMDGYAIKFFNNIVTILIFLSMATFIMWIVGIILAIFNITFVYEALLQMTYGLGAVSIFFSIIIVFGALFSYLVILSRAKMAIRNNEPKHLEYFYATMLVNAIIRVYIEVFKLVLKLLAASNRDD